MSNLIDLQLFGSVFVTLVVIMDPPGALPIFVGLTASLTHKQRVAAARRASLVALGVIAAFAVFGQQILTYLGISLPSLQGAGGLLLLIVALELLTGQESEQHADAGVNVALVPLGTPLLAGPGAIVATMLFVQRSHQSSQYVAVGLGLLACLFVVWLFLRFAGQVHRVLKDSGTTLLTRVAGLLLSAIAVQMIADSVRAFVSGRG
ncbi:MarC family protein [Oryzihumus sp.]|uniref:MarC family protein n=1 Tax=Oryzihumus sp. TaxID=1968903 RepID=UPI002ED99660